MEFHRGRLIDHVHLRAADLAASKRFYRALLGALGREFTTEDEHHFSADELYVSPSKGGREPGPPYVSKVHLAFQAEGPEQIQRAYAAALAAGGRDNGKPGDRPYHPGYYAAYLLDPDGNNIEAVFHGPSERSAPSVVFKPKG